MMSLIKPLSTALSKRTGQPRMDGVYFRKVIRALLVGPSTATGSSTSASLLMEADVGNLFLDKWLTVHDDIRWLFLREAT